MADHVGIVKGRSGCDFPYLFAAVTTQTLLSRLERDADRGDITLQTQTSECQVFEIQQDGLIAHRKTDRLMEVFDVLHCDGLRHFSLHGLLVQEGTVRTV